MMEINEYKNIDEIIARYLSDELTHSEIEELKSWINSSDENKTHFNKMREIWLSTGTISTDKMQFNKEQAFQRFKVRVAANQNAAPSRNRRLLFTLQRIAAAVILFILFCGIGYYIGDRSIQKQLSDILVEAPHGSKTRLYLPDGTLVWLNAGSSIRYSQGFGVNDRKISLNGEAYFEVMKNEKKAFEVTANDMKVKVLGTKFNFRDYSYEEETSVTLIEGKVQVKGGDSDKEIQLQPNQQIVYNRNSLTTKVNSVKAQRASEWIDGIIFFDEEKLSDIAKELERLYNVEITIIDNELRDYSFYGSFIRTEQTIQEVLEVLASTNKLNYDIDGKEITLTLK